MSKTALITGTSSGLGKAGSKHVFADPRASRLATEQGVARVIFDAATDGTDRLRHVATEDIKPLVRSRRETSEQEYMKFMRSQFVPDS